MSQSVRLPHPAAALRQAVLHQADRRQVVLHQADRRQAVLHQADRHPAALHQTDPDQKKIRRIQSQKEF